MFNKFEKYFEDLTRRNWGAPYHFIICLMATSVWIKITKPVSMESPWMQYYTIALFLFAIGYEFYQCKWKNQTIGGAAEDMAFNAAGYLFGILPLISNTTCSPETTCLAAGCLSSIAGIPLFTTTSIKPATICIDAGHGGKDKGAVWKNHLEKNYNLQAAKILDQQLQALDFKTILTRDMDTYLTLRKRCMIANNQEADVFISIHCDSLAETYPHGVQTYYTSETGKRLAAELQVKFIKIYPQKTKWDNIHRADYYVLRGTAMPAVLVEMGFISNSYDRGLLASDWYITRLMNVITETLLNIREEQFA